MNVYRHPLYASSFSEFGRPLELEGCGGWILERNIQGGPYRDAMNCYPLFACKDWARLERDIHKLEGELVSLTMVTDPFGDFNVEELARFFDIFFPFKLHYVTDLSKPLETAVRQNYRAYARHALEKISIEHCVQPERYLVDWLRLYSQLIEHHKITGIRAFSKKSFQVLLSTPGVEMFIARHNFEIIGADIWLVDGEIGYAHLSAISSIGYELRAAYALCWTALQHYSHSLRWLDHGAGAGLTQKEDGLTIFKKGWTNDTRPVFLCGKILDQEKYDELSRAKGLSVVNYFPAYRAGEFL
jgi:hypothetical protein